MSTESICKILNNSFTEFDKISLPDDIIKNTQHFPIQNPFFGLLHIDIGDNVACSNQEQHFVFGIDHSGSMSYKCNDGLTKMEHVIHTLKKIVQYFSECSSVPIFISIFSFDNFITEVVRMVKLDDSTKEHVISQINEIEPSGLTNIELALQYTNSFIKTELTSFPERNITNIFMTDGDVTDGSNDVEILYSNCCLSISNIFIGFGLDHNAYMLNTLGSYAKNSYYFIDNIEKCGLVYGEVISSVLCCVAKNTSVKINNGFIYDWKHNRWITELTIGDIVSNKTYHLISDTPYDVNCIFSAYNDENEKLQGQVGNLITQNSSITKYKYRQCTQELLYKINNQHLNFNFENINKSGENKVDTNINEDMKDLFERMKSYMKSLPDENTNDKKFMKLLCDDIYVCIQTQGTPYAKMYACSRHYSQGSQRVYSSGERHIQRKKHGPQTCSLNSNDSDFYQVSDCSDTPYSAKSVQKIMDFIDKD
jgi:hypothetical protein